MSDLVVTQPRRFLDRLIARTDATPDRVIVHSYAADGTLTEVTVGALVAAAARRAALLATRIRPGDTVFVIEHEPLQQIYWWLASVLAGGVPGILTPPTPKLDPAKYWSDLASILATYRAFVVFGTGVFANSPADSRFFGYDGTDFGSSRDRVDVGAASAWSPPASRDSGAPFVFQQSSGTTGLRKGVLLDEGTVLQQLESYAQAIHLDRGDAIVSWLPLYHDMGLVAVLLQSIYHAIPLAITSPFAWLVEPAWLFKAIERHRATLCWLPNFALDLLARRVSPADFTGATLASLRLVVNCSEPVLPSSVQHFGAAFAAIGLRPQALSSCYAMAENAFAVTQTPPGSPIVIETIDWQIADARARAVPAANGRMIAGSGRAIAGTEVCIAESTGRPCGDGDIGEVWVRGASLMTGYVGIGAERCVIDAEGWYRSGDLGYLRNGTLFVIGRGDDMIIRGGRNINPAYLEAAAATVEGIKPGRIAAFGIANDAEGTDDVVVVAERDPTAAADDRSLRSRIVAACIAATGIAPQRVDIVEPAWLVKSSSGKVARRACRTKWCAVSPSQRDAA